MNQCPILWGSIRQSSGPIRIHSINIRSPVNEQSDARRTSFLSGHDEWSGSLKTPPVKHEQSFRHCTFGRRLLLMKRKCC